MLTRLFRSDGSQIMLVLSHIYRYIFFYLLKENVMMAGSEYLPGIRDVMCFIVKQIISRGPSIYDVHTEGRGSASCGRPHRKLILESTDVILSSSHAKKLVYFLPEFRFWME